MKKLEMLPRLRGDTSNNKSRFATVEEVREWAAEDYARLIEIFGKGS
jgi:hypothetical protein